MSGQKAKRTTVKKVPNGFYTTKGMFDLRCSEKGGLPNKATPNPLLALGNKKGYLAPRVASFAT